MPLIRQNKIQLQLYFVLKGLWTLIYFLISKIFGIVFILKNGTKDKIMSSLLPDGVNHASLSQLFSNLSLQHNNREFANS